MTQTSDPITSAIEKAAMQLIVLVVSWVGGTKAQELVMQAARDQADQLEDAKFGPSAS